MEQNNKANEKVKEVYILQLDKNRLFIVGGLFILLLSGSFLLGQKFAPTNEVANFSNIDKTETALDVIQKEQAKLPSEEPSLPAEAALPATNTEVSKVANVSVEVEEHKKQEPLKIIKEETLIQDDPFLHPPSKRKKTKFPKKTQKKIKEAFYTVQAAAFKWENQAKKLERKLKSKGLSARVVRGLRFYFVRVGKAQNKTKLQTLLKRVEKITKSKPMIVRQKS
ncbi:MAG: SPOR domain-containing protein [Candidatus Hydrogenedentota bacterium]|nr:MAG: SPOR domain-containing protein [Candidatus Hydrogenedentota bacterium]